MLLLGSARWRRSSVHRPDISPSKAHYASPCAAGVLCRRTWNRFLAIRLLHVFENDLLWILFLGLGEECVTVYVFALPKVSGLEGADHEHCQNIEDFLEPRIGTG